MAAHRALLAQILQTNRHDHDVIDRFKFFIRDGSTGQNIASNHELRDILKVCMQSIDNCVIVLDGLDECIDCSEIVADLLIIARDPNKSLLIFSRPAGASVEPLTSAFVGAKTFDINRSTSSDIRLLLTHRVDELICDRLLRGNVNKKEIVEQLVQRADGMFLWADLMIKYLRSPVFTPTKRINIIMAVSLPEKLDEMYDRIVHLVYQGNSTERLFAQRIFFWIVFAKRALSDRELYEILRFTDKTEGKETQSAADKFDAKAFGNAVTTICASLVERENSPTSTKVYIKFIHLSVKEYFLVKDTEGYLGQVIRPYPPSPTQPLTYRPLVSHISIVKTCLDYLQFNIPAQPLGGSIGQNITSQELDNNFPFAGYASAFWPQHLNETSTANSVSYHEPQSGQVVYQKWSDMVHNLSKFLCQKFVLMAWVEASYVARQSPQWQELFNWSHHVQDTTHLPAQVIELSKDMLEFSQYLETLNQDWGSKLMSCPCAIWDEVTAFNPTRFFARTGEFHLRSLASEKLKKSGVGSRYLCKISETNHTQQAIGILSIWPSE